MTTEGTALVFIDPNADSSVAQLAQEGQELLRQAEAKVVDSHEAEKDATDDINILGSIADALEKKRKEYVGPLNDYVKGINATFKTLMEPLGAATGSLKRKILAYKADQDRLRREEEEINRLRMEAAQKEMELKGELSESVNLVEVRPEPSRVDRTAFSEGVVKKVWRFEVEDKAKLPLDYLEPDLVKIRKVVTAGVAIPGVKAWQEETLAVGGRRFAAPVETRPSLPAEDATELPF